MYTAKIYVEGLKNPFSSIEFFYLEHAEVELSGKLIEIPEAIDWEIIKDDESDDCSSSEIEVSANYIEYLEDLLSKEQE